DYISKLNKGQIAISMTEKGDPYENALAERVNGILKTELGLNSKFDNYQLALTAVNHAIRVYNTIRPHTSINYMTPEQAHRQQGPVPARWKSRKQRVRAYACPDQSEQGYSFQ
ncbi:MAG: transposase, partial [Bacteroidetes bacterium]|nr:transposase [Bacteroidota bacterium]